MDPQNARSRRTREALLRAAWELVESDGVGKLTMATVAARAGVTRRSVYLHYDSRTSLVIDLFTYANHRAGVEESFRRVWQARDAAAALAEWAAHLGRCHPGLSRFARAVQRATDADPDAAEHWRLVQEDWRRACLRLARRLDDEGMLADGWTVTSVAAMLQALMSYDVLETLVAGNGWSVEEYSHHLASMARSTFLQS